MKNKLAIFCGLLSVVAFNMSWANARPECPSVKDLQMAGVKEARLNDGKYAAAQFSDYNTSHLWGFGVTNIDALSPADALIKANLALASLSFKQGPILAKKIGAWGCLYNIGSGYQAVALTVNATSSFENIAEE